MAKGNAKQRSFFAIKDRQAKEAAADRERQAGEALKAEQAKKAAAAKAEQARRDMAKRTELRKDKDREAAERRRAAAIRRDFNRDAETKKAEAAREDQRREQGRKTIEKGRAEFNRQAQNKKAEGIRTEAQRRAEAVRHADAEHRKEAARALRNERQAMRDVRQDQGQARQATTFRQRQETDELRARHKAERKGIGAEIASHETDYLNQIEKIDQRERRDLAAFDERRGTLRGRIDEMRKGKAAIDEQRRGLQDRFDQERIATGQKLEMLKDRLLQKEFMRPIEQAIERKGLMETHNRERADQAQRHEQSLPKLAADRKNSIEQAQNRQAEQRLEDKQERGHGPTRDFNLART